MAGAAAAAAEATAEVAGVVDAHAADMEALQAEAERLHDLLSQERQARVAAEARVYNTTLLVTGCGSYYRFFHRLQTFAGIS